jgi:uncharacterized membrane protein YgdD (TMEM256/DUF423 family)
VLFALDAASAPISVGAGAFGAHTLRARLSPELLAVFETGARYQTYHAQGLLVAAWAVARWLGAIRRSGFPRRMSLPGAGGAPLKGPCLPGCMYVY